MLMEGAKLRQEACPACSSPLVQLKSGDLYCVNCEKKVVIVSNESDIIEKASLPSTLSNLENVASFLIEQSINRLKGSTPASMNIELQNVLLLLDIIKKVRELKKA